MKNFKFSLLDETGEKLSVLGKNDVGIIIRENLEVELLIPDREDDNDLVGEAEMYGFAIMMAMSDPEMSQTLQDFANKKIEEAEQGDEEKTDQSKLN
jgi:hypothetical protein